jgi:hypothetical protein
LVQRAGGAAEPDRVWRVLGILLRWRYLFLVVAAFGFALREMRGAGRDWWYFVVGSELIVGQHRSYSFLPGGLHFFANYPTFQIGPLSLLAALPFRLVGPGDGHVPAELVMTAIAPLLIFVLERSATSVWPAATDREKIFRQVTVLFGGLLVVQAWTPLAVTYGHLDDALVLSAMVAAICAVAARRPGWLGLAIGLAIAAKPWGILVLPLVFALPGRARWKALLIAGGVAGVAWLPFVIADFKTLSAAQPQIQVVGSSVLHLLGVPLGDAPSWTRSVQLGCALLVGGLAVWRRRWAAVPLVAIAVRVALDPQVFQYYTSGLVLAALAWDLFRSRRALPLWTLFAFVFLNDAYALVPSDTAQGALRLALTLGMVIAVLVAPDRDENQRFGFRVGSKRLVGQVGERGER